MNGGNREFLDCSCIFIALFGGDSEERRILYPSYAAYPEFNRMIAEQFEKEKIDADIRTVYLDFPFGADALSIERLVNGSDSGE